MPTTTVLPRRSARPSGRAATVLVAGACYAGLLGLVAAPLLGVLRAERAPATSVPAPSAAAGPVVATRAARGFAVPVDDPLLVNEQVYQLLAAQAAGSQTVGSQEPAVRETAVPSPAGPEPVAQQPAARTVPILAESAAPPLPPAAPVDRAALVEGGQSPRGAPEAFVGVWSASGGGCSAAPSRGGYLLATIDEAGAWAGTTRCAFRDKRRTSEGWSFEARCANPRERWSTRVRLRMDGSRLHWASRRGAQTYTRCERRLLTAQAS